MYSKLKPIRVREELLKRQVRIFTFLEFSRIFHANPHATKYFLERQVDEGLFLRLKNGLYTLATDLPSEEEIANKLYFPSYISFEYALAYYNMLPEMPHHITSATTKPTRSFATPSGSYVYYTIKQEAYTGYTLVLRDDHSFLIADPEKTYVDYLYFVTLGKRVYNERFYIGGLDKKKILFYASLFQRESLIKFIEEKL